MLILYLHAPQCPSHPAETLALKSGLVARRVGRRLPMTAIYILLFDFLVGKCRIRARLKALLLTVSLITRTKEEKMASEWKVLVDIVYCVA